LPTAFSVSVFLKVKDEYGIPRTTKIGMLPYVYIPPGQWKKNVSVPCLTTNNLLSDLYCLRTGEKHEFNPGDAKIGVRLDRPVRWGAEALYWRLLTSNFPEIATGLFSNFSGPIWWIVMMAGPWIESMPILNKMRAIYFLQRINSIKTSINPSIVWKKTNVTSPFICSKNITLKADVDKKTDKNGNFNVSVTISNDFDIEINAAIVVDISDEPFFNSLLPTTKETRYNVKFKEKRLSPNESVTWSMKCSFPKGNFLKKNYTVRVECGPYIPIGCSNQFGIYTFTLRWLLLIKPNYKVNTSVQNKIRNFWYNLPLYNDTKNTNSTEIFPAKNKEIMYLGPSPTDMVTVMDKGVKGWILIQSLSIFLLIGFALVGYWFVRKHS